MENRLTADTNHVPGFILGGNTSWKSWTLKGFAVAFHWVNKVPSACIAPAKHSMGRATVVINQGNGLYQFDDPKFLVEKAREYARAMNIDDTWPTIYALCEVITKAVDDLVYMPPAPPNVTPEIGSLILSANGTPIHEVAVH